MYEKLKASECKIKRFQSDIEKMKELNNKEVNNLNDSLISLAKNLKNEQMEEKECFKLEFVKITKIYSETMSMLKNKNEELSAERESLNSLKSECNELNAKIKVFYFIFFKGILGEILAFSLGVQSHLFKSNHIFN